MSITQSFNTANSMGRLTLNVLLTFAQFERELITERIKDKIAASRARGMRFQDQPDYRYGCAAADGYMAVLRQRQPILEQVDAIMSKPRSAELRIRYSRLIVPFRGPDGKTRLLSTSLMDPTIDLRKGVHVG